MFSVYVFRTHFPHLRTPLEGCFCTDDSRDSRVGEGTIFIPLYYFHQLINIQTFICKFACEMMWDYSRRFTVPKNLHLIDYLSNVDEILQLRAKFQATMLYSRFIGSQIPVTTGGFELQISCIQSSYLTHWSIRP